MKHFHLGLIVAMVLSLAGCNRSSQKQQQRLHLFAWSEYVPQEVIDGNAGLLGEPVDHFLRHIFRPGEQVQPLLLLLR